MSGGLPRVPTLVAAVGSGLVAGVFFAFSRFVMKGLARVPAPSGIEAMQGINAAAPTPPFMLTLFGSALVGMALAVIAITEWGAAAATLALIGSVGAVVPTFLTIVVHVPRNDALAALDPNAPATPRYWARYLSEWTAWNHVRTFCPLDAAVMFTLSLLA